jgi:hypothetical protein
VTREDFFEESDYLRISHPDTVQIRLKHPYAFMMHIPRNVEAARQATKRRPGLPDGGGVIPPRGIFAGECKGVFPLDDRP